MHWTDVSAFGGVDAGPWARRLPNIDLTRTTDQEDALHSYDNFKSYGTEELSHVPRIKHAQNADLHFMKGALSGTKCVKTTETSFRQ